ncbi:MAG: NAD-dependent epimerase/dehydratase family protein [Cyanophyceae cyanobacterium]
MTTKTLLTGATGLTGTLFLTRLAAVAPQTEIGCLVRPQSDRRTIDALNLRLSYHRGDSATAQTWKKLLEHRWETIIHLVQLRQVPTLLESLATARQSPRLIIIGTTGVYSKFNQYSAEYQAAERLLERYPGAVCLLRPTMIYGSPRDQNLHRLITFCHRYGFFPVFGSGGNLLQPIHADDIAQALLTVWQHPQIHGAYDLSGGSVVTLSELLALVAKLLEKPVRALSLPLNLGIWSATALETVFGERSPVRREQILRLQEDKAYAHQAATRDLNFSPRSLEVGLRQEVELMRAQGII